MRDGTLIPKQTMMKVMEEFQNKGLDKHLEELEELEPNLKSFIITTATEIAGKLALCDVPPPVVQGCYHDMIALVLLCFFGYRRGVIDYWQDTVMAAHLTGVQSSEHRGTKRSATEGLQVSRRFSVILTGYDGRKTDLARAIRLLLGCPAQDARRLVNVVPSEIARDLPLEKAQQIQAGIQQAGGNALLVGLDVMPAKD